MKLQLLLKQFKATFFLTRKPMLVNNGVYQWCQSDLRSLWSCGPPGRNLSCKSEQASGAGWHRNFHLYAAAVWAGIPESDFPTSYSNIHKGRRRDLRWQRPGLRCTLVLPYNIGPFMRKICLRCISTQGCIWKAFLLGSQVPCRYFCPSTLLEVNI